MTSLLFLYELDAEMDILDNHRFFNAYPRQVSI
jgi:hypothetical protein